MAGVAQTASPGRGKPRNRKSRQQCAWQRKVMQTLRALAAAHQRRKEGRRATEARYKEMERTGAQAAERRRACNASRKAGVRFNGYAKPFQRRRAPPVMRCRLSRWQQRSAACCSHPQNALL